MLRSIRVPYLANLFVVGALLASSSAARATPCAQFSGPCTYVPNPTDYPNVQSDVMGSFEFAAQPLTDDDVSSENGEDLDYWPTADQGDANDYLAYHYSGSTNPRLVVVLPGSGQTPGKYTHFMTRAAHHGFNVIGLMYKNDVPEVNCVDLHSNNVAECQYVQHRFDFQGTPIPTEYTGPNSPHMPLAGYAGVPGYNSVSHRLGQLLKYLNHNFPGQGWGRFLGADGESIAWNSGVIVVGHSHGGGVATFGAQANAFDRLIMFDSTPVTVDTDTPPSAVIFAKLDQPGGTKSSNEYGASWANSSANAWDLVHARLNWNAQHLAGGEVDPDHVAPSGHRLVGSALFPGGINGCAPSEPLSKSGHYKMVMDSCEPTATNNWNYMSTWDYLLGF